VSILGAALQPVQIRDALLNHVRKSVHFRGRISGGSKAITNLFDREPTQQSSQPLGMEARNIFTDVLSRSELVVVIKIDGQQEKRPALYLQVDSFQTSSSMNFDAA